MSGGLDARFDRFRHTAFRYEGLPSYSVPDEVDRIAAWREHRGRPERSVRSSPWLRRIATTTAAGREWTRVRAVDEPIPEYLRYELTGYVENQAVGDRTMMIDRRDAPVCADFWLFDAGTDGACAARMHCDGSGAFHGFDLVTDAETLAELTDVAHRLATAAVPLNHWLASRELGIA